jgi:hypothetical protein
MMITMKFLIRIQPPVEEGNKLVKDPKFIQKIEAYYKSIKAEAAYFYEQNGMRTFSFIVEMESTDKIPSIAEPMFQGYNAKVEFHPVMLLGDLKKGISRQR